MTSEWIVVCHTGWNVTQKQQHWREGGNVTSAGWQVTPCDPIWHVSSRSGVATERSAISALLYFLYFTLLKTNVKTKK